MNESEPSEAQLAREQLRHAVRLALVPGVGPRIRQLLLERFGSAEAALAASPSELRTVPGVGPKLVRQIVAAMEEIDADGVISLCESRGVTVLAESDEGYPAPLRKICDPPGVIFARGTLKDRDKLSVAMVGTRHATRYGLRHAEQLAAALARAGLTIVSGLARGIDAAAHRGALSAGGRTLAVLGSGILTVYPPEHHGLADEIVSHGALLSEAPPQSPPRGGAFPQRNRIISGLTLGTIVVEAGDRSGALITARHAAEQDREVFAVPGPIDSRGSRGCHRLIRDGAKLVETIDDVLEELGPLFEPARRDDGQTVHHPAELTLNELEQQVLAAVGTEPTLIDQIVTQTGLPVPRVLSTISVLEMRRLIRRLSGTSVVRI